MQANLSSAKSIFVTAIEKYRPQEWPIYLDGACGDDQLLRSQVEELLDAHRQVDSFLDKPTAAITEVPEEKLGTKVGPFKLLQKIGEGGFGVVYMAEQMKPIRRKVALKIIKPGMDSKDVVARFEAERQALAMMDHPNIAKVLDAGTTEAGRPYFAMELVKGVSVTEYADNNHLSTRDRLTLFSSICRAVQHAHQKGVIHRDLKPSNVMVTLHDGKPVPKVIDFGVSKAISQPLTEQTLFTRYGQVIGTPQYMSPEQAEMSGLDVDTRSDIYSLGVILYELLTGRTPFLLEQIRAAGFDEMRRMIREQDPVRPSNVLQTLDADTATTVASNRAAKPESLRKIVRGELDWIVMRSLEKDRNRRYDTASSLADDVDRHLNDEPVEATPPSLSYSLWKAYRRHRGVCLAGGAIAAALLLATGVSLFAMRSSQESARQANASRVQAVEEKKKAETAKSEAETQRQSALLAKDRAATEAESAKQTFSLLLSVFSKADNNPNTGKPYTVREAMMELSKFSLGFLPKDSASALAGGLNSQSMDKLKPEAAVELNMGLAEAFRSTGNFDLAILHWTKALEQLDQSGSDQAIKTAECQRYAGYYQGNEKKIREAIAIERDLNHDTRLVASLTLLGRHLAKHDRAEEAVAVLQEACDLFQPHDALELDEVPHFYLARVYHRDLEDAAKARKFEQSAVHAVLESLGGNAETWLQLGKSFKASKRAGEAELSHLVSLAAEGEVDKSRLAFEMGKFLLQLSKDLSIPQELERARFYLRQSYDLIADSSKHWAKENCAYNLSETLVRMKKYDEAVPLLKELANSRSSDFGSGAISLLKLIALDDSRGEVEQWLAETKNVLQEELAAASDPAAVKRISSMLAKYELHDGNMERCMELLGIGGYSIFISETFTKLSDERGLTDASYSHAANILAQYDLRDRKDSEWKHIQVARRLYHNGDLAAAEKLLREALDLSREREKTGEFLHYWVLYELGLLIRQSNPTEAKSLFEEVADGMAQISAEGRRVWWTETMDQSVQLHCQILSQAEIDLERTEKLVEQKIAFSGLDWPGIVFSIALADLRLKFERPESAIESLERAFIALNNDSHALPVWVELDKLVELYISTDQLERGSKYFRDQVTKRDA